MTRILHKLAFAVPAVLGAAVMAAAPHGGEQSAHYNIVHNEDGCSVQVEVDNGKVVTLMIDGDEIEGHRLRLEDGRIYIRQPDGTEKVLEGVVINPGAWGAWAGDLDALEQFRFAMPEVGWNQPKVVIGVNLAEPDAALRYHLGLDEDACAMISGIYKGLPADEGGLQPFDIITAIDGQRPATPKDVRNAIADRDAGESITFDVIQKGKSRRVSVTVEAFDAEAWRDAEFVGDGASVFFRRVGPGVDFSFPGPNIMVDPKGSRLFKFEHDEDQQRGWSQQRGDDQDMQERLDRLNDRLAEMQRMLDELIRESKDR